MSYIYNNDKYNSNLESKNYKIPPENNIIDSIDKRLEMLEKQKEEIQKRYGIDEATLNSINIHEQKFKYPNYLSKKMGMPKREGYDNLTKIEVLKDKDKDKEKEKYLNINYKTPEKLIDSLKYEPNINDLIQEEEFAPKFSNLNDPKSKSINPPTYEINNYIDDVINPNFFDDIFH